MKLNYSQLAENLKGVEIFFIEIIQNAILYKNNNNKVRTLN